MTFRKGPQPLALRLLHRTPSGQGQTEYTGFESHVSERFEATDISWVPLLKALCLSAGFVMEEDGDGDKSRKAEHDGLRAAECAAKVAEV